MQIIIEHWHTRIKSVSVTPWQQQQQQRHAHLHTHNLKENEFCVYVIDLVLLTSYKKLTKAPERFLL